MLDELAERALESYTIELENAEISCETSYTGELRGSYFTGTEEDPATLNMRFTVEFENEETRTDN